MAPVQRHGYEADFKLQAVSHAVEVGNRAAVKSLFVIMLSVF